ncbi:MAG: DNA repair protein RecO [Cyclobacteriaceae bacterium]
MLHKTKGIVINFIKYRESSIIVRIYTRAFGLQSYILNGVRTKNSKQGKIALFQPLTLLDLVVYHKNKDQLQRISEVKCTMPFHSVPYQTKKSSIALFMAEIMSKTLKDASENPALFDFLSHSILCLDSQKEEFENHHLIFLIQLSSYLGFGPSSSRDISYEIKDPQEESILSSQEMSGLDRLIKSDYNTILQLSNQSRRLILDEILSFYQFHLESIRPVKSVSVLNAVLQD